MCLGLCLWKWSVNSACQLIKTVVPLCNRWKGLHNFSSNKGIHWEQKFLDVGRCQGAKPLDPPPSANIVSKGSLERGLEWSAKKGSNSDPPEPPQEGSHLHESTTFTFPPVLKKYQTSVSKTTQKGGPRLSQSCPESVLKTCWLFNRLWVVLGVQNGVQDVKIVKNEVQNQVWQPRGLQDPRLMILGPFVGALV